MGTSDTVNPGEPDTAALNVQTSARHHAEAALAASEEQFRMLVNGVRDYAIFLLDPDGRVVSWNPGAERIKGYTEAEILGSHFSRFYTPEDLATGKTEHELIVARRDGKYEEEGLRVRKDGSTFWASVMITALRDETGTLRGFAKITRDLSERRKAEEELRASEERFRMLVSGIQDYAIYLLDPDGHVVTWNTGAERIKGYRADEIIGQHFSRFYTDEDRNAGKARTELEVAGRLGSYEEEGWRVRKDGTRLWASVVITALRDKTGKLRGFSKVTRDITERRESERIRSIVDNVVDGIVTFDENGTIESLNPAAERIFGWSAAEVVGTAVARLAAEGDRLDWLAPAGGTGIREVFGRRKDGAAFPMDLAIGPFHFQGRRAYTAVVRDITERRKDEQQLRFYAQELRDKNAELARSNQELDDFAYIASHDLKEPLRGIHNYASFLLEDYADKIDEDGRSKLETLARLASRMEALIDSLLQFSRVGRVELSNQDTDLDAVLRLTLEALQITIEQGRIDVRIPRRLPTVRCDQVRVREVFHNLVTNAMKYNDKPTRWVEVGYTERDDGPPVFHVRDNGIGMQQRHHAAIFRIFKRLHGRDKFGGGTGVGLTIVKKIVERHGGTVRVESTPGEGTCFYFTLAPEAA